MSQAAVVMAESAVTALRTVVLAIAQATVMPQQCVGFIVKEEIYHVEWIYAAASTAGVV